jgi:hypothetical protein
LEVETLMALNMKDKKRDPDRLVVCWNGFATPHRVVNIGEKVRASDPIVGDGRWFYEEDTPDSERPNIWDEIVDAPAEAPHVHVRSSTIPVHRQVRSMVNLARPVTWAPDTPGASSGRPAPFFHSTLTQGQILDVLHPLVRQHPEWFEWPRRDVSLADVERIEKHERLEA